MFVTSFSRIFAERNSFFSLNSVLALYYAALTVQFIILSLFFWLLLVSPIRANNLIGAEQLKEVGASFSWRDVRSRSLKIVIEYQQNGESKRANLGSGFLISSDGLFVTAYHVMAYCLLSGRSQSRFAENVDCSIANPRARYKAQNGDREYEIQILSHLREEDSTNGQKQHTPDEIIKRFRNRQTQSRWGKSLFSLGATRLRARQDQSHSSTSRLRIEAVAAAEEGLHSRLSARRGIRNCPWIFESRG
jgi:hypothetical protein